MSHAKTGRNTLLETAGDKDELPALSTGTSNYDTRFTHPQAVCGGGVFLGEPLACGVLGRRDLPVGFTFRLVREWIVTA
jgi:hypothetical protein